MQYTDNEIQDKIDQICKRIEKGEALRTVLKDEGMPSSETFYKWIDNDINRAKQYARSTELRSEAIFDEMLQIADNTIEGVVIETDDNGRTKEKRGDMLGHRRLQIDTRKWYLSKLNPKKYGDSSSLELTGKDGKDLFQPNIIVQSDQAKEDLKKL